VLARFVAGHALRLVGVAGPALDAPHDRLDGDERRISLGDDGMLPFAPIRPLEDKLVLRGIDGITIVIPSEARDDAQCLRRRFDLLVGGDDGDAALDAALSDRRKEIQLEKALGGERAGNGE